MLILALLFVTCVCIIDTYEKIEYSRKRYMTYLETHKEEA